MRQASKNLRGPLAVGSGLNRVPAPAERVAAEKVGNGLVVCAAPVGLGELARNCRYVFVLPPRYNYADLEAVHEVNMIIASDAVEAF